MQALIRKDEIVTEPFGAWVQEHLKWLTTARPDGDGYELIVLPDPPEDDDIPEQ